MRTNVSLRPFSNYKIGGPARYFCEVKTYDEFARALQKWQSQRRVLSRPLFQEVFVLGGGTNLLIGDAGWDGIVIRPTMKSLTADGVLVRVDAGVSMETLLDFTIERGLSGLEWAGGLPGTVGGAVRGNAGAFGGEMKDSIFSVTSISIAPRKPKIVHRSRARCSFGYRSSVFKSLDLSGKGKEIIIEALFKLTRGDRKAIGEAIEAKIKYREARHPIEYPNIGSIFKNVPLMNIKKGKRAQFASVVKQDPFPVVPTAYLIAETGLKGVSFGGAMISPKHPNFIVNVLDAKADEVKTLIGLVKYTVKGKFGIELEEEVVYV